MQAYEAEYVFGAPLNLKFQADFYKFSDDERKLSASIMQYWANFAATGFVLLEMLRRKKPF